MGECLATVRDEARRLNETARHLHRSALWLRARAVKNHPAGFQRHVGTVSWRARRGAEAGAATGESPRPEAAICEALRRAPRGGRCRNESRRATGDGCNQLHAVWNALD